MEQTTHAGLFTRRFGPPPREGAPTVVLVHGLGLSGRYFVPLARRLAVSGATVLVPDLPGNARSRAAVRRTPDIGELAGALTRWHQRLALAPTLLVANSVGCQVVAAFAARHPRLVHRMVLVGPALDPRASGLRQFGRLLADAPREPLSLIAVAAADYLVTGPFRFAASFRHALRDAAEAFEWHLAQVHAPTLVVRGAGDTIASDAWTRRVARVLGDGRAAEVRGAAHAAHYSAPDAVAALIREFTAGRRV
ncbi:alpha/beta hydrolase [Streptomyces agglomeratus]|uniref:Alpha/beta hydrolase n=1 Tax=Streptomyces agglomeratus TaxID=285458 RepID=A0A1E5P2A8_9ACTN|nr:alpha/beta fold hydrolase [Streptomyces agglomeratus]OEJ23660.1 alpha/beta hydrolase [Streptomyces agglomeratus]OEJ43252.1 alpha/beta hydrolase [Streptomyces agglomeratus]OEJ54828.1 alpha/beta hydrolase [Streptomyces agglomeratus]OEJ62200.1 alpha/beta hydrolase [Streptomyces agglomeratus]